jgi:NitT/TauT family transport system substrate-binding protein
MRWCRAWISVSVLFVASGVSLPRADARIVVGVSTVNVAFLPVYLTQDKGFFKDEGLDVLVVMFNAGATNLQAVIGGDVQIMAGGVPETVLARASGVDIKNFWAISNVMPFQIYGRPNIKSLKDGKGKKFAISRFGSLSEFLTRSALRRAGVDPKDVTMLQIGATPARFTTLVGGMVDATILWFPAGQGRRHEQALRSQGSLSQLDQRRVRGARDLARERERPGGEVLARIPARGAAYLGESRGRHPSA